MLLLLLLEKQRLYWHYHENVTGALYRVNDVLRLSVS